MNKEAIQKALEGGGLYEITGCIEDIDKAIIHRSVLYQLLTGPACSLKYDMDTGRMIEVTMEDL